MSKYKSTIDWLDHLAAVVVKTRDGYACQIRHQGCTGEGLHWCHVEPKGAMGKNVRWETFNALAGCPSCHRWTHAEPKAFKAWFFSKFRLGYLAIQYMNLSVPKTWRQEDYGTAEDRLISEAIKYEVDYLNISPKYRAKFKKLRKKFV